MEPSKKTTPKHLRSCRCTCDSASDRRDDGCWCDWYLDIERERERYTGSNATAFSAHFSMLFVFVLYHYIPTKELPHVVNSWTSNRKITPKLDRSLHLRTHNHHLTPPVEPFSTGAALQGLARGVGTLGATGRYGGGSKSCCWRGGTEQVPWPTWLGDGVGWLWKGSFQKIERCWCLCRRIDEDVGFDGTWWPLSWSMIRCVYAWLEKNSGLDGD